MLLQTNSYVVPKEKRAEHARMVRKFRQTLTRLGCDQFDVFEQVGANWGGGETSGRFIQMMRFRDRKHQLEVQSAEKQDAAAQQLIAEFCELINFPYQQQQGLFAVGFYQSTLPVAPVRALPSADDPAQTIAEGTPVSADAGNGESADDIAAAAVADAGAHAVDALMPDPQAPAAGASDTVNGNAAVPEANHAPDEPAPAPSGLRRVEEEPEEVDLSEFGVEDRPPKT
jgi:hypothetical protein